MYCAPLTKFKDPEIHLQSYEDQWCLSTSPMSTRFFWVVSILFSPWLICHAQTWTRRRCVASVPQTRITKHDCRSICKHAFLTRCMHRVVQAKHRTKVHASLSCLCFQLAEMACVILEVDLLAHLSSRPTWGWPIYSCWILVYFVLQIWMWSSSL